MFTGIIHHTGTVLKVTSNQTGLTLSVTSQFKRIQLGESIAVSGVCLTVIAENNGALDFDVSPETLSLTSINDWCVGDYVNLERAITGADFMGGHWVSGHVDEVVRLQDRKVMGEFIQFDFLVEREDRLALLVEKGSVTLNGVSLTVNRLRGQVFSITCVPHTLAVTNLDQLKVGDMVNIEYDMMAKMVHNQLQRYMQFQVNKGEGKV
jgi:riboflavin synthase